MYDKYVMPSGAMLEVELELRTWKLIWGNGLTDLVLLQEDEGKCFNVSLDNFQQTRSSHRNVFLPSLSPSN